MKPTLLSTSASLEFIPPNAVAIFSNSANAFFSYSVTASSLALFHAKEE
jgi:hypothetical protein